MKPSGKLVGAVGASCAGILCLYIPQFEGMILRGYKDPIGIVTACAGHTATAVLGKPYTTAECVSLLESDLIEHAEGALSCIPDAVLTPGERASIISFAYNVGVERFCGSAFCRRMNEYDVPGACDELLKWVYAGGKKLPGLVKRREIERDMCLGKIG